MNARARAPQRCYNSNTQKGKPRDVISFTCSILYFVPILVIKYQSYNTEYTLCGMYNNIILCIVSIVHIQNSYQ